MLAIVGAALAGLPIVFIPLMKLVLTGKNPPAWLRSGMVAQTVVVLLLCSFIVGITIVVQHLTAIKWDDVPILSLVSEFAIFFVAVVVGGLIVLRVRGRTAEGQ